MELKKLTIHDKGMISALFADVFSNDPWNNDWSDKDQLSAYISDLTEQKNSLTYGFFDQQHMIGLSLGHIKHWITGTEYVIDEFCIDRRFQRKGIGSEFLRSIEKHLSESGIYQIYLQTEKDLPAYNFYQQNGFQLLEGHVSFARKTV